MHIHTHCYVYSYICTYMYTHTCIYIQTYICEHINIDDHTRTNLPRRLAKDTVDEVGEGGRRACTTTIQTPHPHPNGEPSVHLCPHNSRSGGNQIF